MEQSGEKSLGLEPLTMRKWEFFSAAGGQIRAGVCLCQGTAVKNWLVFLNGRTEWIEKYSSLPDDLKLPDSCGFLTWDHRGQGASAGKNSHIDTYRSYAEDAAAVIGTAAGKLPFCMLTHSMGGLIGLYAWLSEGLISPSAAVLSSPLLGFHTGSLPQAPLKAAVTAMNMAGFRGIRTGLSASGTNFKGNSLTHNREAFEAIMNSPYPAASPTFGWLYQSLLAIDSVFSIGNIRKLNAPVMLMSGGEEKVVSKAAVSDWAAAAGSASVQPVKVSVVSGAGHELFAEIPEYREKALELTGQWLEPFLTAHNKS